MQGLRYTFRTQLNFRVHCFVLAAVVILGWYVQLNSSEWLWICIAAGLVVVTELLNTAMEVLVDFISPEYHIKAGIIKDVAAAAVLVAAICAVVIGLLIFIPKLFYAA